MEKKIWTKDEIKEKLATNPVWVLKGILAIYARQTFEEQTKGTVTEYNKVGFNKCDANIMTAFAKTIEKKGQLSVKQFLSGRHRLMKYAGQLAKIANGEV